MTKQTKTSWEEEFDETWPEFLLTFAEKDRLGFISPMAEGPERMKAFITKVVEEAKAEERWEAFKDFSLMLLEVESKWGKKATFTDFRKALESIASKPLNPSE